MVIEINRRVGPRADPREREDWFLRLDEDARDVVRTGWLEEALSQERIEHSWFRNVKGDLISGAVLIASVHFLMLLTLGTVLEASGLARILVEQTFLAVFAGAALGAFWNWRDCGQLGCGLSAGVLMFLFQSVGGMPPLFAMISALVTARCGVYVGLRRTEILR